VIHDTAYLTLTRLRDDTWTSCPFDREVKTAFAVFLRHCANWNSVRRHRRQRCGYWVAQVNEAACGSLVMSTCSFVVKTCRT